MAAWYLNILGTTKISVAILGYPNFCQLHNLFNDLTAMHDPLALPLKPIHTEKLNRDHLAHSGENFVAKHFRQSILDIMGA